MERGSLSSSQQNEFWPDSFTVLELRGGTPGSCNPWKDELILVPCVRSVIQRVPWHVASSARCTRFTGEVLSVRLKVCDRWVAELGEFALSAGFRDRPSWNSHW